MKVQHVAGLNNALVDCIRAWCRGYSDDDLRSLRLKLWLESRCGVACQLTEREKRAIRGVSQSELYKFLDEKSRLLPVLL